MSAANVLGTPKCQTIFTKDPFAGLWGRQSRILGFRHRFGGAFLVGAGGDGRIIS